MVAIDVSYRWLALLSCSALPLQFVLTVIYEVGENQESLGSFIM